MPGYTSKTHDKSPKPTDSRVKQPGLGSALSFVDNRSVAVAGASLQTAADSSAQVAQLREIQEAASAPAQNSAVYQLAKRVPKPARLETRWRDTNLLNPDNGKFINTGEMTREEKFDLSLVGSAAATAGAGKADAWKFEERMPDGEMTVPPSVSAFAGASAGFGALADMRDGWKSGKQAADGANSKTTRKLAAGDTFSSLGSATKGAASSTLNFSDFAGAGMAGTATTVLSGAALATGAADIVSGGYGAWKASKRQTVLTDLQENDSVRSDVRLAAEMGAATQSREKIKGYGRIFKGIASVVGGALLLASAASPIGWAALTIGAGVAGAAAAINYVKKKNSREEMAAALLGLRDDYKDWKAEVSKNRRSNWYNPFKYFARSDELGANPMKAALESSKHKDANHVVNNYTAKLSEGLHQQLQRGDEQTILLLKNLGLDVRKRPDLITKEKIASKLLV